MRRFFNDPTSEDGDYVPLTREEKRGIYITAGIFVLILIVEGILIYSISW